MKKLICNSIRLFMLLVLLGPANICHAQSSDEGTGLFTLIVMGTRHAGDIDLLKSNLKKVQSIKNLMPSISSQKHLQFKGQYSGDPKTLVEEVKGIVVDRFELQSKNENSRGLVITLRKIQQ